MVRALEAIGAAVESRARRARSSSRSTGCAGSTAAMAPACSRRPARRSEAPWARTRRRGSASAPTRLAAFAAARRARRRPSVHAGAACAASSAPLPVAILPHRLGVAGARGRGAGRRAGAARDRDAGGAGAARPPTRSPTASGRSGCGPCASPAARRSRCAPRTPHEELVEQIELPEGTAGRQLDRALELLVDRLLAAPQRRGRTLLGLRLGARLGRRRQLERRAGPGPAERLGRGSCAGCSSPRLEALPGPADGAAAAGARLRPAGRRPARARGRRRRAAAPPARRRRCARSAPPRAPRRC